MIQYNTGRPRPDDDCKDLLDDLKDGLEDICDDADARPKMFKGSTCDRLNVGDELPGKPERGSEKPDHCGDAGVTDGVSGMNIAIL